MGWAQVQQAGGTYADIDIIREIHNEGNLKTRLYYSVLMGEEARKLLDRGPEISADNMIDIKGIKYFADGALGSRGAALLEPYDDAEGKGLQLINREETLPVFIEALKKGVQIETHAIGDYANRFVLDLYEEAFNAVPVSERVDADPRWRIEHAQVTHPDDQKRYRELDIIAVVEASTVKGDLYFAPDRIGSERLEYSYLWKSLIDQGIRFTAGTDAAFQEDIRGTIEVGKKADFSIFDKDWMQIEPIEIMDSETVMTIVDGKVTYQR
jgi:hypothetical protein